MKRREIYKYIKTQFGFDFYKERMIYRYVCKEKIGKKDKKRLSEEERCTTYHQWKRHLEEKFNYYSEEGLVELNKLFNLLQRDTRNNSEYNKNICISGTAIILTIMAEKVVEFLMEHFSETNVKDNIVISMLVEFFFVFFIAGFAAWVVLRMNSDYVQYGKNEYFITDVQNILLAMIEEKNESQHMPIVE